MMIMSLRLLPALFFVILMYMQSPALGQSVSIDDVYFRLSQLEKRQAEQILEELYQFHATHLKLAPHINIKLRAYSSRDKYNKLERRLGVAFSAGIYSPRENMAAVDLENQSYLGTLIHEGQHFILGSVFAKVPLWINEGLSEYIETATMEGLSVVVTRHDGNLHRVRLLRDAGKLPKLRDYLALSSRQWQRLDRPPLNWPRAMAWSLVYFLMDSEEGKAILGELIKRLALRKGNAVTILEHVYPGGLAQLEADWLDFLEDVPESQDFIGSYTPLEPEKAQQAVPLAASPSLRRPFSWLTWLWHALIWAGNQIFLPPSLASRLYHIGTAL